MISVISIQLKCYSVLWCKNWKYIIMNKNRRTNKRLERKKETYNSVLSVTTSTISAFTTSLVVRSKTPRLGCSGNLSDSMTSRRSWNSVWLYECCVAPACRTRQSQCREKSQVFKSNTYHILLTTNHTQLTLLPPPCQLLKISPLYTSQTHESKSCWCQDIKRKREKHTTAGIRMWSPTILLTGRRVA